MPSKAIAVRGTRRYYPRLSRRGSSHKTTIPLAIVGGFVPFVAHTYRNYQSGGAAHAMTYFAKPFVPFDPVNGRMDTSKLCYGLYPVALGFLVHWLVGNKLGVNKALGRAKVPFLRI